MTDINLSECVGLRASLSLAVVTAMAIESTVADSAVAGDTAVAVVNTRDESTSVPMGNLKVGMIVIEESADDNEIENYKKKNYLLPIMMMLAMMVMLGPPVRWCRGNCHPALWLEPGPPELADILLVYLF